MSSEQSGHNKNSTGGNVQHFLAFLEKTGASCHMIALAEDRAELRFTGPFEGRDVIWRCEFITLEAELRRLAGEGWQAPELLRNFIEIGEPEPDGIPLRVGLALPRIDASAIEKMMRMIRFYKNLSRGRHEYGDAVSLS